LQAPFGEGRVERGEHGRHVRGLHVAEPGGDVEDPVVVAEVVDGDPVARRYAGHRLGRQGQDHDVLVADVVVLDVGAHGQRGGLLASVEKDGGAGNLPDGWRCGV
jgi:hypothetical protein